MNHSCAHDISSQDPDSHWPAGSPPRAAEHSAESDAAAGALEGAAGRGRPSTCTPGKIQAICSFIRLTGLSDTAAAAMAGVKRSTLARWKKENEEVEMELDQARFQYQAPRLAKIDDTRTKDGQHDWRAQAWLVKFANPEVYGAPSRRRKLRDIKVEPEAERPLTPEEQQAKAAAEGQAALDEAVEGWKKFHLDREHGITPQMLALIQQRRAIAIREMDEEKPAAADGSESAPVEAQEPVASLVNERAKTAVPPPLEYLPSGMPKCYPFWLPPKEPKSVTNRPEIHSLYRQPDDRFRDTRAQPPAMNEPQ